MDERASCYTRSNMDAGLRTYLIPGLLILLGIAAFGYGAYRYTALHEAHVTLQENANALTADKTELESKLAQADQDIEELTGLLEEERGRNKEFEDQIEEISGTVGTLQKLSETDAELLKKYSRVYFLNENYNPKALSPITAEYLSQPERVTQFNAEAEPFLEELLEDAKDDDMDLLVASAYRSFGTQAALKSSYTVRYGSGANAFSADQGYSEHQLGTTLDFTSRSINGALEGFDTTKEYAWLTKNAYKYGFVISYPKGNQYYQYEPWHWRFVGKDLAQYLHEENVHFYDLDQRVIDTYLISLFDD